MKKTISFVVLAALSLPLAAASEAAPIKGRQSERIITDSVKALQQALNKLDDTDPVKRKEAHKILLKLVQENYEPALEPAKSAASMGVKDENKLVQEAARELKFFQEFRDYWSNFDQRKARKIRRDFVGVITTLVFADKSNDESLSRAQYEATLNTLMDEMEASGLLGEGTRSRL